MTEIVTATTMLITGSRNWPYRMVVEHAIDTVQIARRFWPITVMHGGCRTGADEMAHNYAVRLGLAVDQHNADWARYDRAAGPIRNREMVDKLSLSLWPICISFILDNSRGSRGTLELVQNRHLPWQLYSASSRTPGQVTYCDSMGRTRSVCVAYTPAYSAEPTE